MKQQEEKRLERRRRKEADDIKMIDTNSIRRSEYWFLISASWLLSWHNFKSGGECLFFNVIISVIIVTRMTIIKNC